MGETGEGGEDGDGEGNGKTGGREERRGSKAGDEEAEDEEAEEEEEAEDQLDHAAVEYLREELMSQQKLVDAERRRRRSELSEEDEWVQEGSHDQWTHTHHGRRGQQGRAHDEEQPPSDGRPESEWAADETDAALVAESERCAALLWEMDAASMRERHELGCLDPRVALLVAAYRSLDLE
jgi:hypothetical protein